MCLFVFFVWLNRVSDFAFSTRDRADLRFAQDWGVRLARKTAFHAAVQHYTRQLGITAYEPTIPVVYIDPETQELLSYPGEDEFVDGGYDQDAGSQNSQVPPVVQVDGGATKPAMTTLGFELPPDGPGIRARKSRGRKVGMQPLGADG